MNILRFPLGQLQANCYFLINDKECLIIDPGDEANFITEELQRKKLKLVGMISTHGHFDHVMAAGEVQLSIPGTPFYLHQADIFLMKRMVETAKYFLGYDPVVPSPQKITPLKVGKQKIGSFAFEVIETPGHTPGSSSIYFQKEKVIFTGDTLFKGSIGRYDFSYSDPLVLRDSLMRLFTLPSDTIVYPGHGVSTQIIIEKESQVISFLNS